MPKISIKTDQSPEVTFKLLAYVPGEFKVVGTYKGENQNLFILGLNRILHYWFSYNNSFREVLEASGPYKKFIEED